MASASDQSGSMSLDSIEKPRLLISEDFEEVKDLAAKSPHELAFWRDIYQEAVRLQTVQSNAWSEFIGRMDPTSAQSIAELPIAEFYNLHKKTMQTECTSLISINKKIKTHNAKRKDKSLGCVETHRLFRPALQQPSTWPDVTDDRTKILNITKHYSIAYALQMRRQALMAAGNYTDMKENIFLASCKKINEEISKITREDDIENEIIGLIEMPAHKEVKQEIPDQTTRYDDDEEMEDGEMENVGKAIPDEVLKILEEIGGDGGILQNFLISGHKIQGLTEDEEADQARQGLNAEEIEARNTRSTERKAQMNILSISHQSLKNSINEISERAFTKGREISPGRDFSENFNLTTINNFAIGINHTKLLFDRMAKEPNNQQIRSEYNNARQTAEEFIASLNLPRNFLNALMPVLPGERDINWGKIKDLRASLGGKDGTLARLLDSAKSGSPDESLRKQFDQVASQAWKEEHGVDSNVDTAAALNAIQSDRESLIEIETRWEKNLADQALQREWQFKHNELVNKWQKYPQWIDALTGNRFADLMSRMPKKPTTWGPAPAPAPGPVPGPAPAAPGPVPGPAPAAPGPITGPAPAPAGTGTAPQDPQELLKALTAIYKTLGGAKGPLSLALHARADGKDDINAEKRISTIWERIRTKCLESKVDVPMHFRITQEWRDELQSCVNTLKGMERVCIAQPLDTAKSAALLREVEILKTRYKLPMIFEAIVGDIISSGRYTGTQKPPLKGFAALPIIKAPPAGVQLCNMVCTNATPGIVLERHGDVNIEKRIESIRQVGLYYQALLQFQLPGFCKPAWEVVTSGTHKSAIKAFKATPGHATFTTLTRKDLKKVEDDGVITCGGVAVQRRNYEKGYAANAITWIYIVCTPIGGKPECLGWASSGVALAAFGDEIIRQRNDYMEEAGIEMPAPPMDKDFLAQVEAVERQRRDAYGLQQLPPRGSREPALRGDLYKQRQFAFRAQKAKGMAWKEEYIRLRNMDNRIDEDELVDIKQEQNVSEIQAMQAQQNAMMMMMMEKFNDLSNTVAKLSAKVEKIVI
ncbi:unnamed protein product [Sphagnum balticum]